MRELRAPRRILLTASDQVGSHDKSNEIHLYKYARVQSYVLDNVEFVRCFTRITIILAILCPLPKDPKLQSQTMVTGMYNSRPCSYAYFGQFGGSIASSSQVMTDYLLIASSQSRLALAKRQSLPYRTAQVT